MRKSKGEPKSRNVVRALLSNEDSNDEDDAVDNIQPTNDH